MTLKEYFQDYKQSGFARKLGVHKGTLSRKLKDSTWTMEDALKIERLTEGKVTRREVLPKADWTLCE